MRKAAPIVPHQQVVVFRLAMDHFGVDVLSVQEVLRHQPVTAMPDAPDFVEGVISVRGAIVPVIDLRRRFELPDPNVDIDTRILVVDFRGTRLGVVVDEVLEVKKIPESEITDPPPYLRGISADYIGGVANTGDTLIVILDLGRILTSEERIALEATDLDPRSGADADE